MNSHTSIVSLVSYFTHSFLKQLIYFSMKSRPLALTIKFLILGSCTCNQIWNCLTWRIGGLLHSQYLPSHWIIKSNGKIRHSFGGKFTSRSIRASKFYIKRRPWNRSAQLEDRINLDITHTNLERIVHVLAQ